LVKFKPIFHRRALALNLGWVKQQASPVGPGKAQRIYEAQPERNAIDATRKDGDQFIASPNFLWGSKIFDFK